MNTNLTIFTADQIASLKFAELATEYNKFAVELGLPTIKKFSDKTKGQARLTNIQAQYAEEAAEMEKLNAKAAPAPVEQAPEAKAPAEQAQPVKAAKTTFDMTATLVTVKDSGKEGTIENSLHAAIASGATTVEQVVAWIMANHKRPRAEQVDQQYVIHNIKWFIRKGHLKIQTN